MQGLREMARLLIALAAVTVAASNQYCHAEDWPQWRGPFFNGSTEATDLPVKWTQTENIAWTADLPGPSASTPVVWGDHVFVSADDKDRDMLVAICIDRNTGKIRWTRDVDKGIRKDSRSSFSSPSPVTDGQVAIFFYGNGDLVAFDFAGKLAWRQNIQEEYGPFAFMWTFSTSPVLFDGKLFLQVLQRDTPVSGRGFADRKNESYLLALDPSTGEELWRHIRPSKAKAESRESFTTPMPYSINGKQQLLVIGGDDLTGHDLDTGEEIWRWGTWNPQRIGHWRHVPSPIAIGNTILVCAPKRDPIYAIRAGAAGQLGDEAIAWVSRDERALSSDVPTPSVFEGDFIVLSDVRKSLMRVKPDTGEIVWQLRTPGTDKYEASPTVADGKVYLMNFVGQVVVVDAASGDILNTVSMDEPSDDAIRSTIVVAGNQLLIRTNRKLYCVGK